MRTPEEGGIDASNDTLEAPAFNRSVIGEPAVKSWCPLAHLEDYSAPSRRIRGIQPWRRGSHRKNLKGSLPAFQKINLKKKLHEEKH